MNTLISQMIMFFVILGCGFIGAKCFTLSVTRIKLPLQAAEPMSKSKSSMDTPNERRRFFS